MERVNGVIVKTIKTQHYKLFNGDSLGALKKMPDNYVDSIVTDPPYGLSAEPNILDMLEGWRKRGHYDHHSKSGFMGKEWDAFVPQPRLWRECLRVLKPGGHLISFFGTRTHDIGTLAINLAGFEIRDQLVWIYFFKLYRYYRAIVFG